MSLWMFVTNVKYDCLANFRVVAPRKLYSNQSCSGVSRKFIGKFSRLPSQRRSATS
jgi:hypothetical protein